MSEPMKKQSFLHGAALLALATAIVKVIGALYKIPLNSVVGETGFGYFNTAYDIYSVLLMISTAGLPVAMSRMIAEASNLGNFRRVKQIYRTSRAIFLTLGLAGSLLMTVFCHQLAEFQNQPDAWAAIGCLGPAVFLICLMSTFRGFFQGQSNMIPTSVSQVLEAVVKLIVGLGAAILFLRFTQSIPLAAGGAILGVTTSCLISALYLYFCFRKSYKDLPDTGEETESFLQTAKKLLAIAIPITIGSAGLQVLIMLESKVYMGRMLSVGFTQAESDSLKGIYNMAQTIFNMPCAFFVPITVSIIPAITGHLTLKNHRAVRETEESAARLTGLISLPCTIGLCVLSKPIIGLIGGYTDEKLTLAAQLLSLISFSVFFDAIVQVTNAIMQAHGHPSLPVVNMFIGGAVKLVIVYILCGNRDIGILGAPIGASACYLSIGILNLITMRRVNEQKPAITINLLRPLPAALLMGLAVFGAWKGLEYVGITSRLILCAVPVLVGVAVYLVAAVKLKAFTREDCLLLPKGETIAKILHM